MSSVSIRVLAARLARAGHAWTPLDLLIDRNYRAWDQLVALTAQEIEFDSVDPGPRTQVAAMMAAFEVGKQVTVQRRRR